MYFNYKKFIKYSWLALLLFCKITNAADGGAFIGFDEDPTRTTNLFVKTLTGQTFTLRVNKDVDTPFTARDMAVKNLLASKPQLNFLPTECSLVFAGKTITSESFIHQTLRKLKLENESTLHLQSPIKRIDNKTQGKKGELQPNPENQPKPTPDYAKSRSNQDNALKTLETLFTIPGNEPDTDKKITIKDVTDEESLSLASMHIEYAICSHKYTKADRYEAFANVAPYFLIDENIFTDQNRLIKALEKWRDDENFSLFREQLYYETISILKEYLTHYLIYNYALMLCIESYDASSGSAVSSDNQILLQSIRDKLAPDEQFDKLLAKYQKWHRENKAYES